MRRAVRAFALAGALMGGASPAFAAGPAWLEPAALSGGSAGSPAVALAAPGDAAALWTLGGAVESRVRAPQASYGPVAPLANQGSAPDVDVAPDGTAVAAWAQDQSVVYAVRAPGGSFGTPLQLRPDGGSGAVTAVRVVVNAAGDALVSYLRGRAYAAVRPAGGAAGDTAALSAAAACELNAAAGLNGQGAIVFRDCGGGATPIRVARRTGSGFETLEVASGSAPAVAVDTDGTTVVAWEGAGAVRAAAAPQGGSFGPARTISEGVSGLPALAATTDGVWAAWRLSTGPRIVAAHRPTGQDFRAGEAISPDGVGGERPALAGGDGSVVAAWVRAADGVSRVEAARRVGGAARFGPSGLVSGAAAESSALELDVDGDGNALAGYLRGGIVTVQTLDAAGPRFVGVDIREAGHALDVYPFGVELSDAWSSVASSSFDFGDGTTAAGPRAEHAFPSQGERTVTVTATDALGNVSTLARRFLTAPPLDRTAPVITAAKLDVTRFRRTTKETAVVAKARRARRGTRFRYTLSEPAQVNIFFERVLMGRRRGKVCVRGNRRGKRCRVYAPVGLITRTHPVAGKVSVAFTGRIVGRSGPLKLADVLFKPGRYRATIVASDATRNISKPVQLAFTVLR